VWSISRYKFLESLGSIPTVDAFIGMNVDHIGILIKAITWANLQASLIFAAFARFSHDHRHHGDPSVRIVENRLDT